MHKWILLVLMSGGAVVAQTNEECKANWNGVHRRNIDMGFSEEQVEQLLNTCRRRGLNAEQADELLASVYTAHEEGLPAGSVCIKVEEGLAKEVPSERIAQAAQLRLKYLREAAAMVEAIRSKGGAGKGPGNGGGNGLGSHNRGGDHGTGEGPPNLVENICVALESGVPAEVFEQVFAQADRARMGRVVPVVEAAEALQLAGLKPEQYQRVLIDFVKMDLNRRQILIAVAQIEKELADGTDFESVYQAMWK
ncbi:MAG: hypothetical protein JXR40_02390 [Pontiellaceae bacterium]|nr:hypothetical protein [Pontiellaceae bacterium]